MISTVTCMCPETKEWITLVYEDTKIFGRKLKKLREKKHILLDQMSEEIAWNRDCIVAWENGSPVSKRELNQLADYFDVTTDYLLSPLMHPIEQLSLF